MGDDMTAEQLVDLAISNIRTEKAKEYWGRVENRNTLVARTTRSWMIVPPPPNRLAGALVLAQMMDEGHVLDPAAESLLASPN
jgi:hypothetical protein